MKSIFKTAKEFGNIKKNIEPFEYVSFDVFDTLLKRNCRGAHDFLLQMEREVKLTFNIDNFCKLRIESEREIYKTKQYVSLEDIYGNMKINVDNSILNKLISMEIDYELAYSTPNLPMKDVFDFCLERGKKIIAISDMYLSSNVIMQMLKKCGYKIDELFVSCEAKAGKRSGRLFDKVIQQLEIDKSKIVHIGDSARADWIGAKKTGITAIKIPHTYEIFVDKKFYKNISDKMTYSFYKSFIDNNLYDFRHNYYKQYGFAEIGPLVFNFTQWLIDDCKANEIKNIFFFSRDGYILKDAFDLLNGTDIKSHYIHFSRRALRMPFFHISNDFNTVVNNLPHTKILTVKSFVEKLGLRPSKYEKEIRNLGLTENQEIRYSELKSKKYEDLFDLLKQDFEDKASEEYLALKQYLIQEEFKGKIAIVDIGWHNSMQYYLESMPLKDEVGYELYGYYIGIQPNAQPLVNAKGFISDKVEDNTVESVLAFIGLIESCFLAQEGSTEKYYCDSNGVIKPKLLEYEYRKNDLEYSAILNLQSGILEFIKRFRLLKGIKTLCLSGYDSFLPAKTYGLEPYLYDIKKFSEFRYYSEGVSFLAKTNNILQYFLHPKMLKKDLLKSRWKIGFLKKIFIFNMPYYFLYKKLRG